MEQPLISGVAFNRDEAKITVMGVQDRPGVAFSILGPVADENIEVDMIVQNSGADGTTDFTFTVHRNDYTRTLQIVRERTSQWQASEVTGDDRIVKISLVGVGMRSHAGIASRMFQALAAESINIQMISTSEIQDIGGRRREVSRAWSESAAHCVRSRRERSGGESVSIANRLRLPEVASLGIETPVRRRWPLESGPGSHGSQPRSEDAARSQGRCNRSAHSAPRRPRRTRCSSSPGESASR